MDVEFEAQTESEVRQIRSRELQMKSVEKLDEISPIIDDISNINFSGIERSTNEIKNIVSQNLADQPDNAELLNLMQDVAKNISTVKNQITKVSNKVNELTETVDKLKG